MLNYIGFAFKMFKQNAIIFYISPAKILLLWELSGLEHALRCTCNLFSEYVLGMSKGNKNHRYVVWVWSSFPYLGIGDGGHGHGQSKIKVFQIEKFIHHSIGNFKLVKFYKNTMGQKSLLLELFALKVSWNQGVNTKTIW